MNSIQFLIGILIWLYTVCFLPQATFSNGPIRCRFGFHHWFFKEKRSKVLPLTGPFDPQRCSRTKEDKFYVCAKCGLELAEDEIPNVCLLP